jgi:signal transduction histidine kinase
MHRQEIAATPPIPASRADDGKACLALATAVGLVTFACVALSLVLPGAAGTRLTLGIAVGGVGTGVLLASFGERRRRGSSSELADLRASNQQLHERCVRKDEFLASVSHELRTPLNVVLGYIDLLLDHSFGSLEPAQRDILHRITKNASNLSHLINDLVDLSRIEAGRMRIEMEIVELAPLFADLAAVMEVLLAGREVTFRAEIASGCDRLHADPDRLKQIVSNLLVNAVKFTERGGIVLEAAPAKTGIVEISVTDTGIGIPVADQQAIFEPFRQAHDRERRAPGAGIGLSISSRLAVLMGGSLRVESAPGRGSCFTLALETSPEVTVPSVPTTPAGELRKVS